MRGVPGPKGPERPLIAIQRASDDEGLVIHVCGIGHGSQGNGLLTRARLIRFVTFNSKRDRYFPNYCSSLP
jgi:hypothetical protein